MRPDLFHALQAKRASRRRSIDQWFRRLGLFLTLTTLGILGILLLNLAMNGLARIDWNFLSSFPSRRAGEAGVLSAWVGTLLLMMVTAGAAIPFGLAAGIYLEEYAPKNRWTDFVEINIANLAGVPSILYGLMALGLFVYQFQFGQSVLAGGLALACLVLPIVIVATREALRTIPSSIREAAFALGSYTVASGLAPPSALLDGGNRHRGHFGHVAGDWGKCAINYDWGINFYRFSSACPVGGSCAFCLLRLAFLPLYGSPDSDV